MRRMQNEMRKQATMVLGSRATVRLGLVTSYDPDAYAVKVMIQPEAFETGWLPIKSGWAGPGWGIVAGPQNGITAVVDFQEGDIEAGICKGFIFSDQDRPPVGADGKGPPAGELWMQHSGGQYIKLTNDGKITSKGDWVHDGKITATKDIASTGGDVSDQTGKLSGLRGHYNSHHHTDPQGGVVGAPTPTDP